MTRKNILLHGWETAYDKEGWYPPLNEALRGLTSEQASWRPVSNLHSIRELLHHLLFYKDRFLHRVHDKPFHENVTTNEDTFRAIAPYLSETWDEQIKRTGTIHREIAMYLESIKEDTLDQPRPAEPIGAQVFSLIQHDAYHTGQIILLRKLQGSWKN